MNVRQRLIRAGVALLASLSAISTAVITPGISMAAEQRKYSNREQTYTGNAWPIRYIEYPVDEGTWMNVDVSPDGRTIVFDLLGELYLLPIEGGPATPLIRSRKWAAAPRFSPDGREIWFVGDLHDDTRALWAMPSTGGQARRLTPLKHTERDVANFAWTGAAGDYVVEWKGDRGEGESLLEFIDSKDKSQTGLRPATTDRATGPIAGDRPGSIIFAQPRLAMSASAYVDFDIFRYDVATEAKEKIVDDAFGPRLSPDGSQLAFFRSSGRDGQLWIRDLKNGEERMLLAKAGQPRISGQITWEDQTAQGLMPSFDFAPDGQSIYIGSTGKILRVQVKTAEADMVPFTATVAKGAIEPVVPKERIGGSFEAKQLRWLGADRANTKTSFYAAGTLWLGDLRTGRSYPVVAHEAGQFAPSLSPDGRRVAYVRYDDGRSELSIVDSPKGSSPRQLMSLPGLFTKPAWSPDGGSLALTQVVTRPCSDTTNAHPVLLKLCRMVDPESSAALVETIEVNVRTGASRVVHATALPSPSSLPTYITHPSLTYSEDGQSILAVEMSEKHRAGFGISRVDLKTGTVSTLAEIANAGGIDFAIPSPDGRRIAIGANEATWIYQTVGSTGPVALDFDSPSPVLLNVGMQGSHAAWSDTNTLVWSVGNNIFRWRPEASASGKIAELRVLVAAAAPTGILAITNAMILPMDSDRIIERGTILMKDDRIIAVGKADDVSIPSGATKIDAAGKTVVPGFIDTHAHPHTSSCCDWEYFRDNQKPYLASLAWGITTLFDPQAGDDQASVFTQAENISAGVETGPRVFSAGTAIFGTQSRRENGAIKREGATAICPVVRQRALNGAILIKSYLIGRRDYRSKLVECARAVGIGATTEGGTDPISLMTHYMDGHSSTEHNLLPAVLRKDVTEFIGRSGIFYTPVTTAVLGGQEAVRYFGTRGAASESPRTRNFLYSEFGPYATIGGYKPDEGQIIYDVARSTSEIIAAGGRIALGSHGKFDGLGLHHDMWMLQLGGVKPYDLLRAGTIWGAEKLGLSQDLGSIEAGKLADLVVLDCNPLGDIRCSARTRLIIKSGFLYDPETAAQINPGSSMSVAAQ